MLLLEPTRTQFDLNWRMFGIPVRVHPMFWLVSIVLGWSAWNPQMGHGLEYLAVWVACVFVSILIHELGHVCMGMLFGTRGHIVLYSFGGLAIGSNQLPNRWKRMAVSFAGPLAGFLFFVLIWAGLLFLDRANLPPLAREAVRDLFIINLFWNLMNLLPIWPLDGGQISRDFFDWLAPGRGVNVALGISTVCAGVIAVNAVAVHYGRPLLPFLNIGGFYIGVMFALLAVESFHLLQQRGARQEYEDEEQRKPWERDPNYWER